MQFHQFVAGCKNMAITLHDLAVRFEILQQEVKDIRSLVELLKLLKRVVCKQAELVLADATTKREFTKLIVKATFQNRGYITLG